VERAGRGGAGRGGETSCPNLCSVVVARLALRSAAIRCTGASPREMESNDALFAGLGSV